MSGALAAAALLIHGPLAGRLGLYWDDAVLYLRGYHAAHGDLARYVLGDAFGSWHNERPLSYFWFGAARLAFAGSLPAMHLLLVAWLAIEAILLGWLARCLVDQAWFALATGLVFLTYPIAPLQAVWASAAHYHGALVFSLLAMLAAERAVRRGHSRVSAFIAAGAAYLASLLTQEELLLLPLAWLAGLALWPPPIGSPGKAPAPGRRRTAWTGLALFVGLFAGYIAWRILVLPLYGRELYTTAGILHPSVDLEYVGLASGMIFWPWRELVKQVSDSPPPGALSILVAFSSLAAGIWIARAARPSRVRDVTAEGKAAATRALVLAGLLLVAGLATRALIPVRLVTALGPMSRFNFVALPAIALFLPALLHWATRGRGTERAAGGRAALLASALGVLIFAGSLAQLSVKTQLIRNWQRLVALFDELHRAAPALTDGTFVVIAPDWSEEVGSHEEMSSLLAALYDNETLMANDAWRLRLNGKGVASLSFGEPANWFAPGEYRRLSGLPSTPVGAIDPGRLVLFASRNGAGAIVPTMRLPSSSRRKPDLRNHPERILRVPFVSSLAWRHLETGRESLFAIDLESKPGGSQPAGAPRF